MLNQSIKRFLCESLAGLVELNIFPPETKKCSNNRKR